MTTTNAMPVPSAPRTANSGSRRPAIDSVPGPRYGRSLSGSISRRRMTARWAIVNESMAPKA